MTLTNQELSHYSRHIILDEIGLIGQEKLKSTKILIIGAGGLGSPIATYLGAAGVGHLGIIDFDKVELSNLHRQIAFQITDLGKYKAEVLRERILSNNPHVEVTVYCERFTLENSEALLKQYDIVVDGCDNFATRYLVNDATYFARKPLIFGAIHKFHGQASVFNYQNGPCYRCLFPEPPENDAIPNCAEAGVLGVLPGMIGIIQATEAIKIALGKSTCTLNGRFLTYDALKMNFQEFQLLKNPNCPLCSNNPSITHLEEIIFSCQNHSAPTPSITAEQLLSDLKQKKDELFIIDVREEFEREISKIEGSEHIPLRMLDSVIKMLPHDKMIVIYCQNGARSIDACQKLVFSGIKNCFSLSGGITEWLKEVEIINFEK